MEVQRSKSARDESRTLRHIRSLVPWSKAAGRPIDLLIVVPDYGSEETLDTMKAEAIEAEVAISALLPGAEPRVRIMETAELGG